MTIYQYSLIRYRHVPTSGERLNIGLVMWLPAEKELIVRLSHRFSRVSVLSSTLDGAAYRTLVRKLSERLRAVRRRFSGKASPLFRNELPNSLVDVLNVAFPSQFDCFSYSPVRSGETEDPDARAGTLFHEFVEQHERPRGRRSIDDTALWGKIEKRLRATQLFDRGVKRDVEIKSKSYDYSFKAGWQNGILQVLEPVSFDLTEPRNIVEKAILWDGRLDNLSKGDLDFAFTAVVSTPSRQGFGRYHRQAVKILEAAPRVRAVISQQDLEQFIPAITADLKQLKSD